MGTAFTESQAAKLKPYLRDDPNRIVIATDPDSAGWQSAQRAFWRLAALRANPQHLALPEGIDPADILRTEGSAALAERLSSSTGFAQLLIECLVEERLPAHSDAFSRVDLGRKLARIIGALPPEEWMENIQHVAERLDLSLATMYEEVLEAGTKWTDDPQACVARELAIVRPAAPATPGLAQPKAFAEAAQSTNSTRRPSPHRPACTSACSHLPFIASDVANTLSAMDFVLNGRTIALDPTTVRARVTAAPPGPIRTRWVEIDGRRWPPKQFFRVASGLHDEPFIALCAARLPATGIQTSPIPGESPRTSGPREAIAVPSPSPHTDTDALEAFRRLDSFLASNALTSSLAALEASAGRQSSRR